MAVLPLVDDKQVALSLPFGLYLQTDRQRDRAAHLRKAVGDAGALKVRLWTEPEMRGLPMPFQVTSHLPSREPGAAAGAAAITAPTACAARACEVAIRRQPAPARAPGRRRQRSRAVAASTAQAGARKLLDWNIHNSIKNGTTTSKNVICCDIWLFSLV